MSPSTFDPTDDPTHETQQLSFFNSHYDNACYLPVMGFVSYDDAQLDFRCGRAGVSLRSEVGSVAPHEDTRRKEAEEVAEWGRGSEAIDATNAHIDPKPDISLAGVTRSRAALKGRTSSEMVAEMAVGARLVKSISNMPMDWIQDFSLNKPRTVIFTSGDDTEAKRLVIELINSTGFVAIDLGSLVTGGAMHEVGAPLSGLDLHFVRRLR